jgi:hypothetical protein
MSSFPPFLVVVIVGALLGSIVMVVGVVKTVRYHGWGHQKWAPPARPWFIAGLAIPVVTLAVAFLMM